MTATLQHECDDQGQHRLVLNSPRGTISGDWAPYQAVAFLQLPEEERASLHRWVTGPLLESKLAIVLCATTAYYEGSLPAIFASLALGAGPHEIFGLRLEVKEPLR